MILGLDGCEYNFVEKIDLKNLKQKEYGKIKVPINERIGLPLSPEVWALFLTGKHVRKNFEGAAPLEIVFKLFWVVVFVFCVSLSLPSPSIAPHRSKNKI